MVLSRSIVEVQICKYSDFGTVNERFVDVDAKGVSFDDLTIDASAPEFSFRLGNADGIAANKWDISDVVKIWVNKKLAFLGSINDTVAKKGRNGQEYEISGIHYYYAVLEDTYAIGRNQLTDSRLNVFRWGRKVQNTGAEGGDLVDGINVSRIMECVTGNRFIFQDFFTNMDFVRNNTWLRSPNDFEDRSFEVNNPGFENGFTGWTEAEANFVDDGDIRKVSYNTLNPLWNSWTTSTTAKTGTTAAKATMAASVNAEAVMSTMLYQDGVNLAPGDVIYVYGRAVQLDTTERQDIAKQVGARVLVFDEGTFHHPTLEHANDTEKGYGRALVVGTRVSGMTETWQPVGGPAKVASEKNYRVAVEFVWNGPDADTGTAPPEFLFDDIVVVRNNDFKGVSLEDDKVKLSTTIANEEARYVSAGSMETVDLMVGDPRIKKLPYFRSGETSNVYILGDIPVECTVGITLEYRDHVYPLDDDESSINTPLEVVLTQTASLLKTDGQTLYTYSGTIPANKDKVRVKITMSTTDDTKTPLIDYYQLDLPIENYTRQVEYSAGNQVYRAASTGISSDTSNIQTYFYPADIDLPDGTDIDTYATFAVQLINTPLMNGVGELLEATIKRPTLSNAQLPNLPVTLPDGSTGIVTEDSNWDFQIDYAGRIHFKEHIGNYYGKYAGKNRKQYSFANQNLKLLNVTKLGQDVVNNLVYTGQGINGISSLILKGEELIDQSSVNRYGMRIGHVTEKNVIDPVIARSRANAILRKRRSPVQMIRVELSPGFTDVWKVGDIIHIKDLSSAIDSDFRVLNKTYSFDDDGGSSIDVVLSNKNETIDSFFGKVEKAISPLNAANQGAAYSRIAVGTPKTVSRDTPYILTVDIPKDADRNLLRVLLNAHTEAVFSNQAILKADTTHGHSVIVPGHSHSIPLVAHTHTFGVSQHDSQTAKSGFVGMFNDGAPNYTLNPTLFSETNTSLAAGGQVSTPFVRGITITGNPEWWVFRVSVAFSDAQNIKDFDLSIVADMQIDGSSRTTIVNFNSSDIGINDGVTNRLRKYYYIHADDPNNPFPQSGSQLPVSGTVRLRNKGSETVTFSYDIQGWLAIDHKHTISSISGQASGGPSFTEPIVVTGPETTPTTDTTTSHTHETEFQLRFNRNSAGEKLFPTNIHVSLNDANGIGVTETSFNSGPIPELSGIGLNETGDMGLDTLGGKISQSLNVGLNIVNRDISHAFKNNDGTWQVGRHYMYFHAKGNDNQVNNDNLGIVEASVSFDKVDTYNETLVGGQS